MMQKVLFRVASKQFKAIAGAVPVRSFALLTNYETSQPPKVGSKTDYHLDTKAANSKYYNPHTFDP
jgi:hypothetical protein